ncbi:hypothetical protein G9A89_009806 [Geosiphon pyriformis]|nr:hypothetical protein G9A89_009806 [Geosiphon pyriformis]
MNKLNEGQESFPSVETVGAVIPQKRLSLRTSFPRNTKKSKVTWIETTLNQVEILDQEEVDYYEQASADIEFFSSPRPLLARRKKNDLKHSFNLDKVIEIGSDTENKSPTIGKQAFESINTPIVLVPETPEYVRDDCIEEIRLNMNNCSMAAENEKSVDQYKQLYRIHNQSEKASLLCEKENTIDNDLISFSPDRDQGISTYMDISDQEQNALVPNKTPVQNTEHHSEDGDYSTEETCASGFEKHDPFDDEKTLMLTDSKISKEQLEFIMADIEEEGRSFFQEIKEENSKKISIFPVDNPKESEHMQVQGLRSFSTDGYKRPLVQSLFERELKSVPFFQKRTLSTQVAFNRLEMATTFHGCSGDIVDMSFNERIRPKLAMCCIANNDPSYNSTGNLKFWDICNGTLYSLIGHHVDNFNRQPSQPEYLNKTVTDVKFSSTGNHIFSCSFDNTCKVWDSEKTPGQLLQTISCHSRLHRLAVNANPIGEIKDQFAFCEDNGNVSLYNKYERRKKFELACTFSNKSCDSRVASDLAFGKKRSAGTLVVSYDGNNNKGIGAVKIWDLESRTRILACKGVRRSVSCLAVSNSGLFGACGTTGLGDGEEGDRFLRLFSMKNGEILGKGLTQEVDANFVTFSPSEIYVGLGGGKNAATIFDMRFMKKPVVTLQHEDPTAGLPHEGVNSALWASNDIILTGGADSCVRVWDLRLGQPLIRNFSDHDSPVTSIALSLGNIYMAVGVATGRAYLYTSDSKTLELYKDGEPRTVNNEN